MSQRARLHVRPWSRAHARGTVVRSPAVVGSWMVVDFFTAPHGLTPYGLSNGLSLRESPWDPALTYRALTEEELLGATGVRLWIAKGGASRATVVAGSRPRHCCSFAGGRGELDGRWFFYSPSGACALRAEQRALASQIALGPGTYVPGSDGGRVFGGDGCPTLDCEGRCFTCDCGRGLTATTWRVWTVPSNSQSQGAYSSIAVRCAGRHSRRFHSNPASNWIPNKYPSSFISQCRTTASISHSPSRVRRCTGRPIETGTELLMHAPPCATSSNKPVTANSRPDWSTKLTSTSSEQRERRRLRRSASGFTLK